MKMMKALLLCMALIASGSAAAQAPVKLKAGMVTGIDQIGLPIALERGFFEKWGLDVTIARPYATGVDALNAGCAVAPDTPLDNIRAMIAAAQEHSGH